MFGSPLVSRPPEFINDKLLIHACKFSYRAPFFLTCFITFWGLLLGGPLGNLKNKKKIIKKYRLEPKLCHFKVYDYRQLFCRISAQGPQSHIRGSGGYH